MTYQQVKDKYLYQFCDITRGPVLVCAIEVEKLPYNDRWYLHFYSFNNTTAYNYADNIFISEDGINFEINRYGAPQDYDIIFYPPNIEYNYNLIKRLFQDNPTDKLTYKMLEN